MIYNFTHFSIALLWLLPAFAFAQTEEMDLSLEQSLTLLQSENKSLRIAGKEVELAKNEHQKLNAFWYPTISAAGAYVHMSNPVEVHLLEPIHRSGERVCPFYLAQRPVYLITS